MPPHGFLLPTVFSPYKEVVVGTPWSLLGRLCCGGNDSNKIFGKGGELKKTKKQKRRSKKKRLQFFFFFFIKRRIIATRVACVLARLREKIGGRKERRWWWNADRMRTYGIEGGDCVCTTSKLPAWPMVEVETKGDMGMGTKLLSMSVLPEQMRQHYKINSTLGYDSHIRFLCT